jgi:Short C-terminal domain
MLSCRAIQIYTAITDESWDTARVSGRPVFARIGISVSVLTIVVAVVGFVVTLILNAFVLDKFDAYGEVPIPGSGSVQLPAGDVTINFHTEVMGGTGGGGLPVPQLTMDIDSPAGAPDPKVTESSGSTTTVNNDAHVRVWVMQVAVAGTYTIKAGGDVNGYIHPQLAFGHQNSYGWLVWVFVALFVVGLFGVFGTAWLSARKRSSAQQAAPFQSFPPYEPAVTDVAPQQPFSPGEHGDQGVRLEQLKTLAALHDSGALTDAEFKAEKRRILEGH